MRSYSLIAVGCLSFIAVACSRDVPWREPLGAHIAGSTIQAGAPLNLSSAAGPESMNALNASLPAATYGADQATQGKTVYESTCARCHPPGQLDGAAFATAWKNRRVYDLYSLVTNTMPQDKPGSLSDAQYLDVIAYLLQRNSAAAGPALVSDTAALKRVRIAVAGAPAAAGTGSGTGTGAQ